MVSQLRRKHCFGPTRPMYAKDSTGHGQAPVTWTRKGIRNGQTDEMVAGYCPWVRSAQIEASDCSMMAQWSCRRDRCRMMRRSNEVARGSLAACLCSDRTRSCQSLLGASDQTCRSTRDHAERERSRTGSYGPTPCPVHHVDALEAWVCWIVSNGVRGD